MQEQMAKSEAEWRRHLTPAQFRVLREHGTERAFTGAYVETKTPGTYVCAGCGHPLFQSSAKFDSGTGWPSFIEAIDKEALAECTDRTLGMIRTEVRCSNCDGHLGHVFDDGPVPTGLRYCINSIALILIEETRGT